MRYYVAGIPLMLLFLLNLQCTDPENPFENPENVEVDYFIKKSLLISHPDTTFLVGDTICVGLVFKLVHLIDTCVVMLDTDTVISVKTASIDDGDSVWVSHRFMSPGKKMLRLHVAIEEGYRIDDSVAVTIAGKPAAVLISPQSKTLYEADPAMLFITAEGTGPLVYSWYLNDALVSGATNDTLKFPAVSKSDSGIYFCVVDNEYGDPDTSDTAHLNVLKYTDCLLDSLYPSAGLLSPEFFPDSIEYLLNVCYVDSVCSLTAIPHNKNASVTFKPPIPFVLPLSDTTTVKVKVTSPDTTTQLDYTVRAYRSNNVATLDTLYCSGGALSPSFVSTTKTYMVKIPRDTAKITLFAELTDTHATLQQIPQNPITLAKDTTDVSLSVVSEDAQDTIEYTVKVIWMPYTFSKTFGTGYFKGGLQTSDGNYYAGGQIDAQGVLLKISPKGEETKRFSPTDVTVINDMLPAFDSGFVACGATTSTKNGWMAKINGDLNTVGNILMQGSAQEDRFETMTAKRGNTGFIAAGEYNWDRTWNTGDAWLVTVDANAAFLRQKTHGGPARDYVADITQAANAGYFFVGTYFPSASADGLAWICKVTESGDTLTWSKMYSGGKGLSFAATIAIADGGAYCVGGISVQATPNTWMPNGFVMRVNANGDSLWTRQHGTATVSEQFLDITKAHDGGYVCVGVQGTKGWILKIDENGNKVWEKQYPQSGGGFVYSIDHTAQKGYICTGHSDSKAWVLRIDQNGDM